MASVLPDGETPMRIERRQVARKDSDGGGNRPTASRETASERSALRSPAVTGGRRPRVESAHPGPIGAARLPELRSIRRGFRPTCEPARVTSMVAGGPFATLRKGSLFREVVRPRSLPVSRLAGVTAECLSDGSRMRDQRAMGPVRRPSRSTHRSWRRVVGAPESRAVRARLNGRSVRMHVALHVRALLLRAETSVADGVRYGFEDSGTHFAEAPSGTDRTHGVGCLNEETA